MFVNIVRSNNLISLWYILPQSISVLTNKFGNVWCHDHIIFHGNDLLVFEKFYTFRAEWNILENLSQYCGSWYPGAIRNKGVSCHGIGCEMKIENPDSKVHGANMGPIWGWQDPGGPHVGPMNLAKWEVFVLPLAMLSTNCTISVLEYDG